MKKCWHWKNQFEFWKTNSEYESRINFLIYNNCFIFKEKWNVYMYNCHNRQLNLWRHGVLVITTAQLHSTKPEIGFCAGSNPARGVSEIRDGEDLWQWSRLEIKLHAFRRSTIPQKQFIIIIIIIFIMIYVLWGL